MAKALTPIEAFLAPLTRLAVRHDCDGQVIWADGPDWRAQEDETDMLDPDEIAFYAEGMLIEGYCLHWQCWPMTEFRCWHGCSSGKTTLRRSPPRNPA